MRCGLRIDLRGGRERQSEMELRAVAELAFGPDAAAVCQNDVLHDGETESGAA